jgi:hypothetical protein
MDAAPVNGAWEHRASVYANYGLSRVFRKTATLCHPSVASLLGRSGLASGPRRVITSLNGYCDKSSSLLGLLAADGTGISSPIPPTKSPTPLADSDPRTRACARSV